MMGGNIVLAQAFGQRGSRSFGQATGVYKNQGRAVLLNQLFKTIIDFAPDFSRHDRFQRRAGDFYFQITLPFMTGIDNRAMGCLIAVQKLRHQFDRFLGGG